MTELDLTRLGRHVAEREDALLAEDAGGSEGSRRFLAEYAARTDAERAGDAPGAGGARAKVHGVGARALGVRLGLAAMAMAAAVALFVLKGVVFAPVPLSFTVGVDGKGGVLRDWASAPDDTILPIRFSDGTRVLLEPRARARVVAVSDRGAEIVIESGRAHLNVVPAEVPANGESPWRVSLGPFSVEVKGTRFDVEWDPRTDDFALDLFEGSVRVSGCQEGHTHTLVAGQGVRASCSQKRWALVSASEAASSPEARDVASGESAGAASDAGDSAEHEAGAPGSLGKAEPGDALEGGGSVGGAPGLPRATVRSPARAPASPRSWRALALRGHYSAAFERALEVGFEAECERVGAGDLVLLGDTARLGGDAARARSAYLAARRRFGGSPAAAQAAFGLGRLAVKRDPRAATGWFERSLAEAPRGPLSGAARDWLFELVGETGSPARRREMAESYLEHYPDGAHAEDARRILEANGR